jgi:hypothetical protein
MSERVFQYEKAPVTSLLLANKDHGIPCMLGPTYLTPTE